MKVIYRLLYINVFILVSVILQIFKKQIFSIIDYPDNNILLLLFISYTLICLLIIKLYLKELILNNKYIQYIKQFNSLELIKSTENIQEKIYEDTIELIWAHKEEL